MFAIQIGVYIELPADNNREGSVHLGPNLFASGAVVDVEIVEDVLVNLSSRVVGSSLLGAIHDYQVLELKEHCVEAGGVGVVLDVDLVVNDGDGLVIVEDTIVYLGKASFFSKGDEALSPEITLLLHVVTF